MIRPVRESTRLRLRVSALVLCGALLVAVGLALLLGNTVSQRHGRPGISG
jgi:hypothetical protein